MRSRRPETGRGFLMLFVALVGLGSLGLLALVLGKPSPTGNPPPICARPGWTCELRAPGIVGALTNNTARVTLLTVVGGPGLSGTSVADSYSGVFPVGEQDGVRFVFIDPPGTGANGRLTCDRAATAYARAQLTWPDAAAPDPHMAFATACAAEAGVTRSNGAQYGTEAIVAGIATLFEARSIRDASVYGESFGSRVALGLARRHPELVASLILDAPIEASDTPSGRADRVKATSRVFDETVEGCAENSSCSLDFGGDPAKAIADLVAEAQEGRVVLVPPGTSEAIVLSAPGLQRLIASHLKDERQRVTLLRSLAAATRDELEPLARIAGIVAGFYPEVSDNTWLAAYYAATCADILATSPSATSDWYASSFGEVSTLSLASLYWADMPCLYWPRAPATNPAQPAQARAAPTMVIAGSLDPFGGHQVATDLFVRGFATNFVEVERGGHLAGGRGNSCVDTAIRRFLFAPTEGIGHQTCQAELGPDYRAIPTAEPRLSALGLMVNSEIELSLMPELAVAGWSDSSLPCRYGGAVRIQRSGSITAFSMSSCSLLRDWALTGSGRSEGTVTRMDVTLPNGALTYLRDGQHGRVHGTLNQSPVDLSN